MRFVPSRFRYSATVIKRAKQLRRAQHRHAIEADRDRRAGISRGDHIAVGPSKFIPRSAPAPFVLQ